MQSSTDVQSEVICADFLQESMNEAGPLKLLVHGRQAFREVPGLSLLFFIGMSVCLLVGFTLLYLVFIYLFPLIEAPVWHYYEGLSGWLQTIAKPLIYLMLFFIFILLAFICFKGSFLAMSLCIDLMIEKVMVHHRPELASSFSLQKSLHSAWNGILISLRSLFYVLLFLPFSFIPLVGPLITFVGISRGAGSDSLSPYILLLTERDKGLFRKVNFRNRILIKNGSLTASLSLIPFVGWIGVPVSMVIQSVGFCHFVESRWKNDSSSAVSTDIKSINI